MDEFISTAEAAQRLTVSENWIRQLCAAGRVPGAKKIGRDWIIPAGAKIEVLHPGRPLRTTEIPRNGKKGGRRSTQ